MIHGRLSRAWYGIPLLLSLCLLSSGPGGDGVPLDPVLQVQQMLRSDDVFDRIVAEATLRGLAEQAARTKSLDVGGVSICLHPDTRPEDAERILRELPTYIPDIEFLGYYLRNRWTQTATNPSTGTTGDPITLTWSIVPDGTDADGGPSDLYAVFNAAWGSTGWIDKIRNAFNKWQVAIGIIYVEVSDDGASLPENFGLLGARGDVRLSGRSIDGPGNVLAYDYYPNIGDMVLDTDDVNFYHNPVYNYGNLRNVVAHEHGHGIGLGHVIPTDCTKLMEPYNCNPSIFVGPQDDDIRGGMRYYGDPKEINDTSAQATVLGSIGDSLVVTNLSIDNGNTDIDWFSMTLVPTALTIEADPVGSSYSVGPDGGTETWVATDSIADIDIDLYDAAGATLLASATANGLGATEVLNYTIPSAADYKIRIYRKAGTGNGVQRYTMKIYSDPSAGVVAGRDLAFSVYPNPSASEVAVRFQAPVAGQYKVEVFDVSGRLRRAIVGKTPNAGWVEAMWDGRTDKGVEVPSGVYFIRVASGPNVETARVLLVK